MATITVADIWHIQTPSSLIRGGVIGGSNPEIPARKSKNPEISEENFENIGSRKKILKNTKI